MKIAIPEELKSSIPATMWGKVLSATPVIMTVIATMLAGLASSEMTKAQYDRALAAQQQSKAGDQWSFFQAKRLRGSIQSSTLDVVQATATARRLDNDGLRAAAAALSDPAPVQAALASLLSGRLPEQAAPPPLDPSLQAALDGLDRSLPDTELVPLINAAPPDRIVAALHAAQERAREFDALLRPVVAAGDRLGAALDPANSEQHALARDFMVLRLRYAALRYDAEARINQSIASLLELQVRQSNLSAERHHNRSQRFFYGMLGAQAAVIIATFALAARNRNFLWLLAALAGFCALGFAAYVFLFL